MDAVRDGGRNMTRAHVAACGGGGGKTDVGGGLAGLQGDARTMRSTCTRMSSCRRSAAAATADRSACRKSPTAALCFSTIDSCTPRARTHTQGVRARRGRDTRQVGRRTRGTRATARWRNASLPPPPTKSRPQQPNNSKRGRAGMCEVLRPVLRPLRKGERADMLPR